MSSAASALQDTLQEADVTCYVSKPYTSFLSLYLTFGTFITELLLLYLYIVICYSIPFLLS